MMNIKVTMRGLPALNRRIDKFMRDMKTPTRMWPFVIQALRRHEKEVFSRETGYRKASTVPWPFYDRTFADDRDMLKYIKWKNREYPGSGMKLLVLSGRLKNALTKGSGDSLIRITPKGLIFGVKNAPGKYGSYHNTPPSQRAKRFPPAYRPFLHWNPLMEKEVDKAVNRFVKSRVGAFKR